MKNKIGFISLGCCKNLVDAERMMTLLAKNGYQITGDADKSDLVVINTCGFLNSAVKESMDTIGEMLDSGKRVLVTGCLAARDEFIREVFSGSEGLKAIRRAQDYDGVLSAIKEILPLGIKMPECAYGDLEFPGLKLTPPHYGYLKISEGCSNKCSFCAIPALRGPMHSRPADDVLKEAYRMAERGMKEIIIVAQDTMRYGRDIAYEERKFKGKTIKSDIFSLLDGLKDIDAWVRLHYLYPYPDVAKLLPLMKDSPILPYLDVPFQHVSKNVLKNMSRPGNTERLLEDILAWREEIPDLCVRSSFIVGFPGETEKDFYELLEFIKKARLDRVGCFAYSNVNGVRANDLEGQISEDEKLRRQDEFMKVQMEISASRLAEKVGTEQQCLLDEIDEENALLVCRSKFDSPEIDGNVLIPYDPEQENLQLPKIGALLETTIDQSDEYDLIGDGWKIVKE